MLSVSRTCLYLASRSLPQSSSAERIGLGLVSAVAACVSSAGLLSFGLVSGMAPCVSSAGVFHVAPIVVLSPRATGFWHTRERARERERESERGQGLQGVRERHGVMDMSLSETRTFLCMPVVAPRHWRQVTAKTSLYKRQMH